MQCWALIVEMFFLYAADIVAGAQYPVLSVRNHSDIEVPISSALALDSIRKHLTSLGQTAQTGPT